MSEDSEEQRAPRPPGEAARHMLTAAARARRAALEGSGTADTESAERAAIAYALLHIGDGVHRLADALQVHALPRYLVPRRVEGTEHPSDAALHRPGILHPDEELQDDAPRFAAPDGSLCGSTASRPIDGRAGPLITLRCGRPAGHRGEHEDEEYPGNTWTDNPDQPPPESAIA